jgi:hypothetical protein
LITIRLKVLASGPNRSSSGTAGRSKAFMFITVSSSRVIAIQSCLLVDRFYSSLMSLTQAMSACRFTQSRPRRSSTIHAPGLHLEIEIEQELAHGLACDLVKALTVLVSSDNSTGERHLRCFRHE